MDLQRVVAPVPAAAMAVAAAALSGLGDPFEALTRAGYAAGGLAGGAAAALVWGERTALQAPALRWFGGLGLALLAFAPVYVWLPAAALVAGLLMWNDQAAGPGMLLAFGAASAVLGHAIDWDEAGFREAWWIAAASLMGCAAAFVERERLASPRLHPVPASWTSVRIVALASWTFALLVVFAAVKEGDIAAVVGLESTTLAGQIAILAILLAATVAMALAFTRRAKA